MKFSIIIPVYNVAPYLRECLDSVMNQTFSDWEAICIDDGSTDESPKILDEYAARDKRFVVVHQSNMGVSSARNAGLELARGEYIGFLDADDVIGSFCLKVACEMSASSPDLISFGGRRFADDGTGFVANIGTVKKVLTWREFSTDGYQMRSICQAFYAKKLIGNERFISGMVMGEDRELQARLLARANKFAVVDDVLYGYRNRASSAVNTEISAKKFVDRLMASRLCRQHFEVAGRFDPSRDARFRAMNATEFTSADYFALSPLDRKLVKPVWDETLRYVRGDVYAPPWCRFAASVSLFVSWDWVRYLLFRMPLWMKSWGGIGEVF